MGALVRTLGITALFLSALLSGCIFSEASDGPIDAEEVSYPPIWDRHTLEWETDGSYSLVLELSLIHISEPTRQEAISYAVFCLKKKQ